MGLVSESSNIILFPKVKRLFEEIENESYEAIQEQHYEIALEKLNYLEAHQYVSYDIHISKLICLIKLKQLEAAEQYCEDLLQIKNPKYLDYLDYYLMILYDRNKFTEIMFIIKTEEKTNTLPQVYRNKFRELYRLAYHHNLIISEELMGELNGAITDHNHRKQWHLLNKWKKLNMDAPQMVIQLLKKRDIHPAVKTLILEILRRRKTESTVIVEKFNETVTINIKDLLKITEHPVYEKSLKRISYLEQENPSLFSLVQELLFQFSYIRYPLFYSKNEVENVTDALIHLGYNNLALTDQQEYSGQVCRYIDMIQLCSELYLNIRLD